VRRTPAFAPAMLAALFLATPLAAQERVPAEPLDLPPVVVPSEPIPESAFAADTVKILEQRFREMGQRVLATVPTEDRLPKNPRNAAIRAFLVPGWGQFYTGHKWRGVLFAVAEVAFLARGYSLQLDALDKKDELEEARQAFFADPPEGIDPDDEARLLSAFETSPIAREITGELEDIEDEREDFYAWGFLSVFFAALDAYVSAQLDPIEVGAEPAQRRVWGGIRIPLGGSPDPRR